MSDELAMDDADLQLGGKLERVGADAVDFAEPPLRVLLHDRDRVREVPYEIVRSLRMLSTIILAAAAPMCSDRADARRVLARRDGAVIPG